MTAMSGGSIAVGACIREARERAGLSQTALGDKLGVTPTCLSYWEAGKRDPGVAGLLRLACALGVQAASLLPVPHRDETSYRRTWTEWAVAYGGEDPNECAGILTYDDEAEARDMTQWIDGGFVAQRTVAVTTWGIVPSEAGDPA